VNKPSFGLSSLVIAVAFSSLSVGCLGGDDSEKKSKASNTDDSQDAGTASEDDSNTDETDQSTPADTKPATKDEPEPATKDTPTDTSDPEPASPSNDTGDRERLPESLREACMSYCDAQYAVDCAPQASSIEICDLQCVASVSNQRQFCIEEYTERTQCLGEGGFECVNDYPVARSNCASETVAYSECVQDLPCKLYCAELAEIGCTDDELDCREQCVAETTDDDALCRSRQNNYVNCIGLQGATCSDGNVIPHRNCISALFDAADCRNDGNVCAAWCEGAAALGCGSADCQTDCEERLGDATCGTDYERMLDCGIRYGYVGCGEDGLETDPENILCDSEVERYAECVDPPPAP